MITFSAVYRAFHMIREMPGWGKEGVGAGEPDPPTPLGQGRGAWSLSPWPYMAREPGPCVSTSAPMHFLNFKPPSLRPSPVPFPPGSTLLCQPVSLFPLMQCPTHCGTLGKSHLLIRTVFSLVKRET